MERSWDNWTDTSVNALPRHDVLARVLCVGGGGCGKRRIVNRVITPLIRTFDGPTGLQTLCASNKAASVMQGKMLHAANQLQGTRSLSTGNLRISTKNACSFRAVCLPVGGNTCDEFLQVSGQVFFRADVYITSLVRVPFYGLKLEAYADVSEKKKRAAYLWLVFFVTSCNCSLCLLKAVYFHRWRARHATRTETVVLVLFRAQHVHRLKTAFPSKIL